MNMIIMLGKIFWIKDFAWDRFDLEAGTFTYFTTTSKEEGKCHQ